MPIPFDVKTTKCNTVTRVERSVFIGSTMPPNGRDGSKRCQIFWDPHLCLYRLTHSERIRRRKGQYSLQRHDTTCCRDLSLISSLTCHGLVRDDADLSPTSSQRRRQMRDFIVTSFANLYSDMLQL